MTGGSPELLWTVLQCTKRGGETTRGIPLLACFTWDKLGVLGMAPSTPTTSSGGGRRLKKRKPGTGHGGEREKGVNAARTHRAHEAKLGEASGAAQATNLSEKTVAEGGGVLKCALTGGALGSN